MFLSSDAAAAFHALSRWARNVGIAIAASIPMMMTTVLLPNYKHGRAKVTHYVGRERRPKGRAGESLEYNHTAARLLYTVVYGRLCFFALCLRLPVC